MNYKPRTTIYKIPTQDEKDQEEYDRCIEQYANCDKSTIKDILYLHKQGNMKKDTPRVRALEKILLLDIIDDL
jgi:hypothetical protein